MAAAGRSLGFLLRHRSMSFWVKFALGWALSSIFLVSGFSSGVEPHQMKPATIAPAHMSEATEQTPF